MEWMKASRYIVVLEDAPRAKKNRRSYSIEVEIDGEYHFYSSVPPQEMRKIAKKIQRLSDDNL